MQHNTEGWRGGEGGEGKQVVVSAWQEGFLPSPGLILIDREREKVSSLPVTVLNIIRRREKEGQMGRNQEKRDREQRREEKRRE